MPMILRCTAPSLLVVAGGRRSRHPNPAPDPPATLTASPLMVRSKDSLGVGGSSTRRRIHYAGDRAPRHRHHRTPDPDCRAFVSRGRRGGAQLAGARARVATTGLNPADRQCVLPSVRAAVRGGAQLRHPRTGQSLPPLSTRHFTGDAGVSPARPTPSPAPGPTPDRMPLQTQPIRAAWSPIAAVRSAGTRDADG